VTRSAPKFELNPRLRPAGAARAVALAQLDHALHGLAHGDPDAVHEARKVCKKLRALLRLVRPFLGRAYRAENARLRDVGRALSQGREAAVLVETADALFGSDDALEPLAERIRERPHPETGVSLRDAQQLLQTERRRVAEWPVRELSAGSLMAGLLGGYRRARAAYRQARRGPTALALHEWRKQAKYHGYQSALVSPLWPDARTRVDRLKKLSDLLGHHHDLHVLAMLLRRQGATLGSAALLKKARRKISGAQREDAQGAFKLGKLLFGQRPLAWLAVPAS
jgi:CHAD domain-containing protein